MRRALRPSALLSAALLAAACGGGEPPPSPDQGTDAAPDAGAVPVPAAPQSTFWAALEAMCGQAFEGRVTENVPPDPAYGDRVLTMHVRECAADEIRVPFHVEENRSRTWVFTRTAEGLRLKHDHRHEDGTEDALTWYGGDTRAAGTAERQEFHADVQTVALVPEAATNIWTVEIVPGERFTYALRREGTERRFRADFDLTRPVAPPPAPWGH